MALDRIGDPDGECYVRKLDFGVSHQVRDVRRLMLWLFIEPIGVYLLDFFCSGIQFYLLLSPYLCFISLLYLDLYVFRDDTLIS